MKDLIIVKYGSSSTTDSKGVSVAKIAKYSKSVKALLAKYDVVIVSSGSVAAGRSVYLQGNNVKSVKDIDTQSLAMLGTGKSFTIWQDKLQEQGVNAGQLLITHRELDDIEESPILRDAIRKNISYGIVTIANENDALSIRELALLSYGGENDGLAGHLAVKLKAKTLCLMNDMGGIYDDAKTEIHTIEEADWDKTLAMAKSRAEKSRSGTGGVLAKVTAAVYAASNGVEVYIAKADEDLGKVISDNLGTHFVAKVS